MIDDALRGFPYCWRGDWIKRLLLEKLRPYMVHNGGEPNTPLLVVLKENIASTQDLMSREMLEVETIGEQLLDAFCTTLPALFGGSRILQWLEAHCTKHSSSAEAGENHLLTFDACLLLIRSDLDRFGFAMQVAAYNGNYRLVELLCEDGASINSAAHGSPSALHLAAGLGYIGVQLTGEGPEGRKDGCGALLPPSLAWVVDRIDQGANAPQTGSDNKNSDLPSTKNIDLARLRKATESIYCNIVSLLLKHQADTSNQTGSSFTPLFYAAAAGSPSIVKLLLQHGACVNDESKEGSALFKAADLGHDDVVTVLLENGADVDQISHFTRMTPLHAAASKGHESTVRLLSQNGANLTSLTCGNVSVLSVAVANGHEMVVQALLQYGASPNPLENETSSPLYEACSSGKESLARLLIEYGADINDWNFTPNITHETALGIAARNGHESIVRLLLERGAELTDGREGDPDERLAVLALMGGHVGVFKLLLQAGASVYTIYDYDDFLWVAAERKMEDVVQLLVSCATPGGTDGFSGVHLLKLALSERRYELSTVLLRRLASEDAVDVFEDFWYEKAWRAEGVGTKREAENRIFDHLLDALSRFASVDEAVKSVVASFI